MTTEQLTYYQQTLLNRLHRLWRLRAAYSDELNDTGVGMLKSCFNAAQLDCRDAGLTAAEMIPYLSFAPPPPAKPSPEGRP